MAGCTTAQHDLLTAALGSAQAADAICAVFDSQMDASEVLATRIGDVAYGLNTLLLLYGGALVFLMHGGFAMVRARATGVWFYGLGPCRLEVSAELKLLLVFLLSCACMCVAWRACSTRSSPNTRGATGAWQAPENRDCSEVSTLISANHGTTWGLGVCASAAWCRQSSLPPSHRVR